MAAESNISLTVDAEEADRLEISWEMISAIARLPDLRGWMGSGLQYRPMINGASG